MRMSAAGSRFSGHGSASDWYDRRTDCPTESSSSAKAGWDVYSTLSITIGSRSSAGPGGRPAPGRRDDAGASPSARHRDPWPLQATGQAGVPCGDLRRNCGSLAGPSGAIADGRGMRGQPSQRSSKPYWSNFRVRAFSETMRVLSSGNPSFLDAVISTVISRSTPSGAARCWMTSWYSRLISRP